MSVEQNAMDHLHDWHVDLVFRRERQRARGRHDAFGDGFLAAERGLERRALADLDTERAIATQRTGAGEHEIADAGESGERRGLGAERDPEPRHLVQARA